MNGEMDALGADTLALIEGIKARVLADIAVHPGSNAAAINWRIRYHDSQLVLALLKDAEREGKCRSRRIGGPLEGAAGILWELAPTA